MKLKMMLILSVLFMIGSFGVFTPDALLAQRYPDRPIELIIPAVAGGIPDITGRMLAEELEKIISTKIVPINRPGASGVVGADSVVRGKKDGYTLFYAHTGPLIIAPVITPEAVHYNVSSDLEPLGFHYFLPHTVTVRADSSWKTFPEFIDYAKNNPGKIRVSVQGVGSTAHLMIEQIQVMTGAQLTLVPFKGGESVVTALLGNHVEATFDGFMKVKPHVDAGKMRILLISNKMANLPAIPTIDEFGYKESLFGSWVAPYAPAGIPEEVRKFLVPAIEKAIKNTKPRVDQMGNVCAYMSPLELKEMWEKDYKQVFDIAVKIGLRKQ